MLGTTRGAVKNEKIDKNDTALSSETLGKDVKKRLRMAKTSGWGQSRRKEVEEGALVRRSCPVSMDPNEENDD
jgi:hypothetical protein